MDKYRAQGSYLWAGATRALCGVPLHLLLLYFWGAAGQVLAGFFLQQHIPVRQEMPPWEISAWWGGLGSALATQRSLLASVGELKNI